MSDEDRQFHHPGGRVCTLQEDGSWRYGAGYLCPGPHLITGEDDDRGDLGMPTLGAAAIGIVGMPVAQARANALARVGISVDDLRRGDQIFMPVPGGPTLPEYVMRVSPECVVLDYGQQGQTLDFKTDEARVIFDMLPDLLFKFLENNAKYAKVQTGHDLGAKGIIPDINRKTGVLIDRLWDGSPTVGEDTVQVIQDLIGHLLLLLAKMPDGGSRHE